MTAWPSGPLPLRARMYLANDWRDITPDVRTADGGEVTVTVGEAREQAVVTPSKARFDLINTDGRYAPRNVVGPWYGALGPNTPMDFALSAAADTFAGRTVASDWGTSSSGHAWSMIGTPATDFAVASGVGTHRIGLANVFHATYLPGVVAGDVAVGVTVSLPVTNITGAQVEPANIMLRGQSTTNYYLVRVAISTAEAVTVTLMLANGTVLAGPVTVAGLTHTSAQSLRVLALIEGETLRAKVWPAASGQPYGWHITATDDTITAPGWVGVRSGAATGNTNVPLVFSYDDFAVHLPLFAGELGDLPQTWEPSGALAWASVNAAGILRRLGLGRSPLQSAPRRYLPSSGGNAPVAYWPGEDGQLAINGAPVVGSHPLELFSTLAPSRHFGQGDLGPWLTPGVALYGLDELYGSVDMPGVMAGSARWAVDHVRAGDHTSDTLLVVGCGQGGLPGVAQQQWTVRFIRDPNTLSGTITVSAPDGVTSAPMTAALLWDGLPHHVRLYCEQSGANTAYYVDVDSTNIGAVFSASTTLEPVRFVSIQDLESAGAGSGAPFAVGHIAVYGLSRPTANFAEPVLGRRGERAGARMARLCTEVGIPFTSVGDLTDTEPMGPQGVGTVLDLLSECAEADGGILSETRGVAGLLYRTRRSLYNQTAALTSPYSGRQQIAHLKPAEGNMWLRNDVTIERRNGGSARHELTTGPLSTADPPVGAGRADDTDTLNLHTDLQCAPAAQWAVHLGAWDGPRFDAIDLNLLAAEVETVRTGVSSIVPAAAGLRLGDRVVVTDPPVWCGPDDVDQQVIQLVHRMAGLRWRTELTGRPNGPWRIFVVGDAALGKLADNGSSTLTGGVAAVTPGTVGTLSVTTSSGPLWTTDAAEMPLTVDVEGETVTVTAITGTTNPQTFTVARGANGVSKAHATGAVVRLLTGYIGR